MNYHNITYPDMNNGLGLRVVLWLSGCNHQCKGCQNSQTWDVNSGIPFDEKAKEELFKELDKDYISGLTLSGGDPLHERNLDGVLDIVNEFNKRYRTAQNIEQNEVDNHNVLSKEHNENRLLCPDKTIWIYSGYNWDSIFDNTLENMMNNGIGGLSLYEECEQTLELTKKRREIISLCDVMVDGKYVEKLRDITLHWIGSSNQRVIDVSKTLKEGQVVLYAE